MSGTRFVSADQAAEAVPNGAVVALTGSGGGILEADGVFAALERRFLATGSPRDLTIIHGLGIGDGVSTGLSRFAHSGMTRRVIGGHWSWSPAMQQLAAANEIEAYAFPAGVIAALLRESGAQRPGLFTRVGLGTFVDPRREGGKLNARAVEDLVEVVVVDGSEYLHFKPLAVDVGIVRGTSADTDGNVSGSGEAATLDSQAVAAAARGHGGLVIAQVKSRAVDGEQDPRMISIPGPLVDCVVVHADQWQTSAGEHTPAFTLPAAARPQDEPLAPVPPGVRSMVARRAALEVQPGSIVNVGYGMSAGVVDVLREQDRLGEIRLVIEQGATGGMPETGALFGLSRYPSALLSSLLQFDFFATGMVDVAVLGMAEADREGNVNVSMINGQPIGPGGFIDIVHGSRQLVFCGSFTAAGLCVETGPKGLRIVREGAVHKFVEEVAQVTFDARAALERGQSATYVTERAVFKLTSDGLALTEVAPGVDLERDVLGQMGFAPVVSQVQPMSAEVFAIRPQPVA